MKIENKYRSNSHNVTICFHVYTLNVFDVCGVCACDVGAVRFATFSKENKDFVCFKFSFITRHFQLTRTLVRIFYFNLWFCCVFADSLFLTFRCRRKSNEFMWRLGN